MGLVMRAYAGRKLLQLFVATTSLQHEGGKPLSPGNQVALWLLSLLLVCLAGLMSGLTLGLMSIDKVDTEVIRRSGTPHQRRLVEKIEPVLSHPHFLLVTLLLTNAVAMEALPIFLDRLLNPVAAILISVTAVLLFGEIIPQAVCKRYGLQVGAYLAWLVRGLMLLTAPISYPIALLLDYLLGEESALFRRAELKALVSMHAEPPDDGGASTLTQDEVNVIQGALDMATKTAQAAMTPLEKVFMFPSDAVINDDLLKQAIDKGHSRVPVYEGSRQNIVGLILVKELVLVDEDVGVRVKDLRLREVPFLRADIPLYDVLKIFRTGRSHMAVLTCVSPTRPVSNSTEEEGTTHGLPRSSSVAPEGGGGKRLHSLVDSQEAIGIITIEDVLEELLQQEIVDETDRYVDNLQTVRTTTLLSLQHLPPNLRKFLTRTFRAGSPVNRAAFQAALAVQNPFAPSPPSTGPLTADGTGGLPSANASPQKSLAVAAVVAAAAAAAAAAEDVSTAANEGSALAQHLPPQQPQQMPPAQPAYGETTAEGEPLLRPHQGRPSSSSGGPGFSPLRPPLPKLRVNTAPPPRAARALLDYESSRESSPVHHS